MASMDSHNPVGGMQGGKGDRQRQIVICIDVGGPLGLTRLGRKNQPAFVVEFATKGQRCFPLLQI